MLNREKGTLFSVCHYYIPSSLTGEVRLIASPERVVFVAWVNGPGSTPAIMYIHTQLELDWLLHT